MKTLDIRQAVIDRMKARQITAYHLAKLLAGAVPPSSVYAYIAGSRDLRGESLGFLLAALELSVV